MSNAKQSGTSQQQRTEQERLKAMQGSQGSGGSYGTGGGFEGEGETAPDARNEATPARVAPGKDRASLQGDFGEDVGPDGRSIEGPPTKPGDAQHGYSQDSGYTQSGGHSPAASSGRDERRE